MVSFCTFMTTSMPEYDKAKLDNVLQFLLMMPVDVAVNFISQIDSFRRSSDAFKYMTKIHLSLLKSSKKYKEDFYDKMIKAGEGKI